MSTEKRLFLFLVLSIASMWGIQLLLETTGLLPPPQQPAAAKRDDQAPAPAPEAPALVEAEADTEQPDANDASEPPQLVDRGAIAAEEDGQPVPPVGPEPELVALADPEELVLGALGDPSPDGYHLQVRLEQKGAGVASVASSRFAAEAVGQRQQKQPLELVQADALKPPSLALTVSAQGVEVEPDPLALVGDPTILGSVEADFAPLDREVWEVVRDEQERAVRPLSKSDPTTRQPVEGQEIVFRATVGAPPIEVTKVYRLWKGEDGFEQEIGFRSPSGPQEIVYRLLVPHGIPVEGEWYTGTFRDVFFAQQGASIVTRSAYDVAKARHDPERFTTLPLRYAGVENQYFAVFVEPRPDTPDQNWIAETVALPVRMVDPGNLQLADVSVRLTSRTLQLDPDHAVTHRYRIFAGPKTTEALAPYGAEELASYRKGWSIPFASDLARYMISPLLSWMYGLTEFVARLFGGTRGNYGVAIILLTMVVRLMLFPLSRKQAIAAKKMQDLQPQMMELREKLKDDREAMARETMALYKRSGVNPLGGCLLVLIQLPIFVGLWQALNNSVALRHAPFLYIRDLAAPDMLFKFPFEIPLIGGFLGPYFNLLPVIAAVLMLVQMKLFAPPPTTPEAEMQQKMMKFMMIFMVFLFFRIPSGLGLYFITSSLWAVGERKLLPKMIHDPPAMAAGDEKDKRSDDSGDGDGRRGGGPRGGGGDDKDKGGGGNGLAGGLRQRFAKILEEAAKDPTIRNAPKGGKPEKSDKAGRDKSRPRRPSRRR